MKLHKIALGLAVALLLAGLAMVFDGKAPGSGPCFVAFFIALAIGVRGWPAIKELSYTVCIFAAVTASMFRAGILHPYRRLSI